MKQFKKIFGFEFRYYLKNKIFVGVTVLLVAVLAIVMFFPRISESFTSDKEDAAPAERETMLVKALYPEQSDAVKELFSASFTDYDVQLTDESEDAIKEKVKSEQAKCAFVLTSDRSYTYYVNNLSMYDTNTSVADGVLTTVYQINSMISGGMSPVQAAETASVQIDGKVENLGVDQMQNYFYTYIMIFALYMVILLYGQMVATNVATEKSSRAMELLITSANPTSMMFGKVLASCLAGLLQIVAVFGSSILFYTLNESYWSDSFIISSIFDMPPELFIYMIVFFILGFLIYAFLYGAVGSTVSKLEDINTAVMPITLLFIAGFFVVVFSFSSGNIDTGLMKVCSYIPFTSPMAMFTRLAMSTVPWYETAVSIAILAVSVIGTGVISAKIYRIGVLLYGTSPKLGSILKSVFKS